MYTKVRIVTNIANSIDSYYSLYSYNIFLEVIDPRIMVLFIFIFCKSLAVVLRLFWYFSWNILPRLSQTYAIAFFDVNGMRGYIRSSVLISHMLAKSHTYARLTPVAFGRPRAHETPSGSSLWRVCDVSTPPASLSSLTSRKNRASLYGISVLWE